MNGDMPARQWYTLDDVGTRGAATGAPLGRSVLIEAVSAGAFHDSVALTYSREPGMRAHYHFAGWVERPSRRIANLLERRLAERGRFTSVAQSTTGVRGDLLLRLTLNDAYHDLSVSPGVARVLVTAELIDWRDRRLVGRREFAAQGPVRAEDAAAAVRGFRETVADLLDAIGPWSEALAEQLPPGNR